MILVILMVMHFWQTSRQIGSVLWKDFEVEFDGVDGDGVSSSEVLSCTSQESLENRMRMYFECDCTWVK